MKILLKTITLSLILIAGSWVTLNAQQEAHYSMYFFNPLLINPGYAGSQDALTVTGLIRDQWTNFEGAPKTQGLSIHTPLKNKNIGIGLTVINDEIGANKNTAAFADFAYSIKLNKKGHRLVFGIKAGVDFYRTNFLNSRVNDATDNVYLDGGNYSKNLFNAGAGVYYYGKRFYLGASVPTLVKNDLNLPSGQKATQQNHFYAFGGLVIKLNSAINMRPSFVVKYVNNAPISVDGNLSFLFYDKVWLGAMYRLNSAVGANVMFAVTPKLKLGYAYDFGTNAIQNYSVGSHEFMLSFTFKTTSNGFKSPRYF